MPELARLVDRDADGVDAAHLAGADPDRLPVARDHDRVRAHVSAHAPREQRVLPLRRVEVAGHDLHRRGVLELAVAVLHEQPAEDARVVALARSLRAPLVVGEDAERLLRAQGGERIVREARREQHLDEVLGDPPAELLLDRPVEHCNAAEGRYRVGRERTFPRLLDRRGDGDAARAAVLHDHGRRLVEVVAHAPCALEIGQVVVRQLPSAELLDARQQMAAGAALAVVGGRLVRVLAVGEVGDLLEAECEAVPVFAGVGEPRCDLGVVGGGRRERRRRKLAPRLERRRAELAQLAEHVLELLGAREGRDVREVLRRRAEQGGAADVDQLDHLLLAGIGPARGRRERIEVDADELEGIDRLLGELRPVVVAVEPRQDAGVDPRVQRLHAAAEQLGGVGDRLDRRHGEPVLGEERRRAARRDELEAELVECAGELVDARLVVGAQERAAQSLVTTSGSSRCSTAWIRSTSVDRGSTGTSSCAITGPVSMPSST